MITSRRNARLKDIRRVQRSKGGDVALLEGPHLIAEALAAKLPIEASLATPDFLAGAAAPVLLPQLPSTPLPIAPALLEEVTDSDAPRGIIALARLPRSPGPATLPVLQDGIYVYVDGVQDPGNLGALARVAEAAGAAGLCLAPGSVHPNHPRALRASAGSLLRLPIAYRTTAAGLEAHLQAAQPVWWALLPRGGHDLYSAAATALSGCLVLTLGAEGPGLDEALVQRAGERITIPLGAPVESLNVTVAAAIALFELRRARQLISDGALVPR